jgi:hypothetical protein
MTNAFSLSVAPANALQNTGVQTFMCPGRGRQAYASNLGAWSDYHINVYLNLSSTAAAPGWPVNAWNAPDAKRTLLGITDGTSNTIFAGHGYMDRSLYAATTWNATMGNFSGVIWVGGMIGTARRGGMQANNVAFNLTTPNPQPGSYATPSTGIGPATKLLRDDLQATTGIAANTANMPWGGPFPVGALFVWCDGTVRQVAYSTAQTNVTTSFGSYLTPTGGEAATLPD